MYLLGAITSAGSSVQAAAPADSVALGPDTARMDASGTRLTVSSRRQGTVSIFAATDGDLTRATIIRSFSLRTDLPYILSADGKFLVGFKSADANNAIELASFDIATGVRKGSVMLDADDKPDDVWTNSKGTAVGMFARGRFIAYSFEHNLSPQNSIFERSSSLFMASSSGRFVFLANETGNLIVIDSASWHELPLIQSAIQQTVHKWLQAKAFRTNSPTTDGPFVYPVTPIEVSSDDRLVSIFLGENANTFLNICISSGKLLSKIVLDKRVTATSKFSATGKIFSVQVIPNSDDSSFLRPASYYGLRLYDSYSGKILSTIPIPNADWSRYQKEGAKFFLDEWRGWLGFLAEDAAALRIDTISRKPQANWIRTLEIPSRSAERVRQACSAVSK